MEEFKRYIASDCSSEISPEVLDALVARYGWFTAARTARAYHSAKPDPKLTLATSERIVPLLALRKVDVERLLATGQEDIIEKFLQLDNYRIVADEGDQSTAEEDIRTVADFDEEDDLVSEELAEVYLSQGLKSEAIAIYRKLSLLNPKKSIYFAELIEQIEKQ